MPRPDVALTPLRRLAAVLCTWALLNLAQPGLLRPDGFGHLAFFALGPWAWAASRPGPRAFVAEWAGHALGLLGWWLWMRHLLPWLLLPMAVVPSLYLALGGVLLRRLARRFPLALAAPVAWLTAELVRWHLPAPLSFGWLRTGELMHDTLWLSGSVRTWGPWGLTYVLGALGGLAADIARARSRPVGGAAFVLGVGPLFGGVLLALLVDAPRTAGTAGVVIAQPGIEQELKGGGGDPVADVFVPLVEETLAGVRAHEARFGGPPDLVLWGESILLGALVEDAVLAAYDGGARPPAWTGKAARTRARFEDDRAWVDLQLATLFGGAGAGAPLGPAARRLLGPLDRPWVRDALAGRRLLPERTALLAGVERWVVRDGDLLRENAVGLWDVGGRLVGSGAKTRLVPAAEDVGPVVRLPFMLDVIRRVGGYVPDFVPGERTGVVDVALEGGRRARAALTVCYDNAFDAPFLEPLARGPVDLFVVASNEAWYRTSPEMDHLLAAARVRALMTGRPVARATNSGISAVIDGAGRDVAILAKDGRRKMVRGHLAARVPLPADPLWRGPFARSARLQVAGWGILALILVLLAAGGRSSGDADRP